MSGGTADTALDAAIEAMQSEPDPQFKTRLQQAKAALIAGLLPWLTKGVPEHWDTKGRHSLSNEQLFADIKQLTGFSFDYVCAEEPDSAKKAAFDAFAQEHCRVPEQLGEPGVFCYHGSSRENVHAIHENGFDPSRYNEGAYGTGGYVSTLLPVALSYAALEEVEDGGCLWVAFGRAHFGDRISEIPIGTRGQTDFGVREDGTRHTTLTNPVRSYFCLSQPRQFLVLGYLGFTVNFKIRPSDFALQNMVYSPALWRRMTESQPGLVAYKQNLLRPANKDRLERLHRRQQKRLADEDEGDAGGEGPAKRTRGA